MSFGHITFKKAIKAFWRNHQYAYDPSSVEHQKWVHGYMQGWISGKRAARRAKAEGRTR